jgi:hypothetical protein
MKQCPTVCSAFMYKWNQILSENLLFFFILISQMYLRTNSLTFTSMVLFSRADVELVSLLLSPFPMIIHHTPSSREAHTCSIPIIWIPNTLIKLFYCTNIRSTWQYKRYWTGDLLWSTRGLCPAARMWNTQSFPLNFPVLTVHQEVTKLILQQEVVV